MRRRRSKKRSNALICEELEPRLLLSADLVGIAVDLTPNDAEQEVEKGDIQAIEAALQVGSPSQVGEHDSPTVELVIIDPATPDYQSLVDDLISQNGNGRSFEIVLLDSTGNGIEQISDILSAYQDLDAVHILSHGSDGGVQLGDAYLNLDSLSANAGAIESWREAFSEAGDLLIYGCDLAASGDGQSLVEALARLTGADVAASDDLTGHEGLGGDWELEHAVGVIEAEVAVSEDGQRNWSGILATDVDFIDADDPVHHWKLDGDAVDSVGSADGTITDATTVTGWDGDALRFDESGDYVTIPDVTMNSDFTVTFQFKVDDNTGSLFQYIYSHGDINTTNSLNIFINEASHGSDPNVLRTVIRDADDTLDEFALQFDISTIVGDGEWHTYTLTVEAGVGSTVYLDGVVKNTDTRGGGGLNPSGNIYLGTRYDLDAGRMFGGDLDDVKIYDHVHPPTGVGTGLLAGTVIATDPVGGTVTYSLVDDAGGMFSIDSDSGELFWTGAPDTSTAQSYDITVRVTDSGAPTYDEVMTIKTGTGDLDSITGTSHDDLIYGLGGSGSSLGTTNYIVNGSFENTSTGWTDVSGAGWDFELSGNHGVIATDGSYYIDMTPDGVNFSIIEQAVAGLTNGTTYQLSFDAGLTGDGDGLLHVYWNGALLETIDPTSNTLQSYTYNVVAGSGDATNTLRFDEDGPNTIRTTALDNVRMYEVLSCGGDTIDGGAGDDILIGDGIGGSGTTSQPVTIDDAGFEDPPLADGGWTYTLPAAWFDLHGYGEAFIGNPDTSVFSSETPEGENALFIPEDNQIFQTLASSFDSSKDYELSLKLGNPLIAGSGDGNTYSIQLYAGGTLIGSATGTEPATDSWTDINISVDGDAYAAADGTALKIVLTNTSSYSGNVYYFGVDDIQLNEITASATMPGDDTLTGGAGDDYLDGGAGTDTAVFSGSRADYDITWYAGTSELVVSDTRDGSPDGTDTLINIEELQFADQTVTITDPSAQFNDPPVISSNGGGDTANINVAENSTAVTTVTSTDPDLDTPTYSISGGADAALFSINSSTGELTFISAPDYETPTDVGGNNVYDVQVQVSDGNGGTDVQDIAVTVTDANDAPVSTGGSVAGTEDTAYVISWSDFTVSDVDSPITNATGILISSLPADGQLEYFNGNVWTSISLGQTITKNTVDAAFLRFTPDADEWGDDGSPTPGVGNGLQDYAQFDYRVVHATAISINNPGGESDALTEGTWLYSATGWTTSGADAGAQNMDADVFPLDHDNTLYTNVGATLSQTLGSTFSSNNNYDLTLEIGWRGDVGNSIPPEYRVELWAGATRLGFIDQTDSALVRGELVSATLSIDGSGLGALDGQNLEIRLVGVATQANYDNLQLISYERTGDISSGTAEMTVDIAPVNDAPVNTTPASVSINEDTTLNFTGINQIQINDVDHDGGMMEVQLNVGAGGLLNLGDTTGLIFSAGDGLDDANMVFTGTLADINAALLTLSFDPDLGFSGDVTFTIVTSDLGNTGNDPGLTGTAGTEEDSDNFTITVTAVNSDPVITSNDGGATANINIDENTTAVTTVAATDTDLDTLTYSIDPASADADKFTINSSTGVLTFIAAPDFETPTDANTDNIYEVTVEADDGNGGVDTQALSVTVTAVSEEIPVANADSITVAEGGTATTLDGGFSTVLNNDIGLGDTPVTVSLITDVTNGSLTLNGDGTFSYTHDGSENFNDSFTYRVTDNDGETADATVTINVTPVSDQTPVANADSITVAEGGTATTLDGGFSTVLNNDTGLGDTPVTVSLVTDVTNGSLTLNGDGTFSYTHDGSENFTDSFTYRVTDNDGETADATVTINVTPVSDATPVANADTIIVAEG
ncbi:MAG: DUF4347 domain-containing protein, partial [Candidatus Thiodiazotropha sp.]